MTESDLNLLEITGIKSELLSVPSILRDKLQKKRSKNLVVAFDGYLGVDWSCISAVLKNSLENSGLKVDMISCSDFWKKPEFVWKLIKDNLECDPHFGRVYSGRLDDFIDQNYVTRWLSKLKEYRKIAQRIFIFYGNGVVNRLTSRVFDVVFYVDIPRTMFLKNMKQNSHRFLPENYEERKGQADVGMSLTTFKLSQYVCSPVFDKHRRSMLKRMDYYVLFENELKVIKKEDLRKIVDALASGPFVLQPLYIPGPWGGQWIKNRRKLGQSLPNCAWAFEAVTGDMHLPVLVNDSFSFNLPFKTFLVLSREKIMGAKLCKRFGFFFPVRVHYDDSYDGGNMAIQVHPDKAYCKKNFSERVGQHEAYYIVTKKEGAGVYLGLKEKTNIDEFKTKVSKAISERIPLDYDNYVNFIESRVGDLFLIPAGTIHALGKNQVCLEIGTSYGYTFHVYDYLRPDLNGNLREIHIEHAFAALKKYRTAKWVGKNLVQTPRVIGVQGDSKEYLLGRRRGMIFEVRKLELEPGIWSDGTEDTFHILTLVNGDKVELRPLNSCCRSFLLKSTRTIIVPQSLGDYTIVTSSRCEILKVIAFK